MPYCLDANRSTNRPIPMRAEGELSSRCEALSAREIRMLISKRIIYGAAQPQFADLRLPSTRGPHPLVALFHGGFWRAAYGLDALDSLATALTVECGVATWNVEYRRV